MVSPLGGGAEPLGAPGTPLEGVPPGPRGSRYSGKIVPPTKRDY